MSDSPYLETCNYNGVMDGNARQCHKPAEIWATYPMGCPGDLWFPLCLNHFLKAVREDIENSTFDSDGGTFGHGVQLVSYVDPSTLPNHGFPQYQTLGVSNG